MALSSEGWIDVTVDIRHGMLHWPGDHDVEITKSASIPEGSAANVTYIQLSAHTGTHVDAPLHFIDGGKDIASIALHRLMGKVKVIEISDPKEITLKEIKDKITADDQRVIFKTRNSQSDWFMKDFTESFVYLATDAAIFLREKGILTVGIDYLSIAGMDNGIEVHRILLGEEIFIIEGLDLRNIQSGDYEMICLPLKIQTSDGSPARVLLKKI
ncbi:MAG: cyclase family protein [Flavobacteriales bacterium]